MMANQKCRNICYSLGGERVSHPFPSQKVCTPTLTNNLTLRSDVKAVWLQIEVNLKGEGSSTS